MWTDKFELEDRQIEKIERFKELLIEKNKVLNLTAVAEEEFDIKHIYDSLTALKSGLFEEEKDVLDLGCGGGLPGIVLKIARENLNFTLMDSTKKKIDFIDEVIEELELKKIRAIHSRAEEAAHTELRESFELVISRAVANLRTLLEYSLGFVKPGGYFIAMKSGEYKEEEKSARNAAKAMGAELSNILEFSLPDGSKRSLVIYKKTSNTPDKYPRSAGKPRKKPL